MPEPSVMPREGEWLRWKYSIPAQCSLLETAGFGLSHRTPWKCSTRRVVSRIVNERFSGAPDRLRNLFVGRVSCMTLRRSGGLRCLSRLSPLLLYAVGD